MKVIEFIGEYACIDGKRLNNEDFIFVSNGPWFVKDSICRLEANCGGFGALLIGTHLVDTENEANVRKCMLGYSIMLDSELCAWEEVRIYDKDRTLLVEG